MLKARPVRLNSPANAGPQPTTFLNAVAESMPGFKVSADAPLAKLKTGSRATQPDPKAATKKGFKHGVFDFRMIRLRTLIMPTVWPLSKRRSERTPLDEHRTCSVTIWAADGASMAQKK